jgi:mono/diheme cytochrome c family protein
MNRTIFLLAATLAAGSTQAQDQKKIDFTQQIRPILQKSCVECHGPDKQKGKLRLDTREAAFKGGAEGAVIKPSKPEESELFKRITLPADHDDRMPSEGDPLTKEQIDLIREWINQGAEWPEEKVVKAPEKPKVGLDKLTAIQAPPDEAKAIAKLESMGLSVRPIAMNVNWKEANLGLQGTNGTDAALAVLKDIPTLVHLNLRGTKITDAGLENLKTLTNLVELHLEKTDVTDAGLAHIKGLVNLTYLNLYGTQVSDSGLEHLKPLKDLQSLYLWQTKATTNGIAELQKSLPQVKIVAGLDLTPVAKVEEKKEEKKEEAKKD